MKIKKFLLEDTDKIVLLLESLGCKRIKKHDGYIKAVRPEVGADNPSGVSVKLNSKLTTSMFTTKGNIGDIVDFVGMVNNTKFKASVEYIKRMFNLDDSYIDNFDHTLRELKKFKKKEVVEFERKYLDESYLSKYEPYIIQEWVDEGISPSIQQKYDIRIDKRGSRWIIPIRDENNNLVSVKGRTYLDNYKILDIPKYIYYTKLGYNDLLFGMYNNKDQIIKRKEVIIFEGEKSVMKAETYGFNNCIAVGMGVINAETLKKIISLNADVVLALDKGLIHENVMKQAEKLKMFCNVYIIEDKENLLKDKDAPVDQGMDTFITLYNKKRRVF